MEIQNDFECCAFMCWKPSWNEIICYVEVVSYWNMGG